MKNGLDYLIRMTGAGRTSPSTHFPVLKIALSGDCVLNPACQFAFITAWLSGMIRFIQDSRGNENKVSAVRL
jgi:hypothetical protein